MSSIRPARADDVEALARLTTQLGYPTDPADLGRRLEPLLTDPGQAVVVAVDDMDAPVGWVHVARTRVLQAEQRAEIHGLVVDEERRSGGIGNQLLSAAEEWAGQRGIGTVLVRSRSTRERAHQFYEREGYRRIKRSHVFEKRLG